jgi:omega-amidase
LGIVDLPLLFLHCTVMLRIALVQARLQWEQPALNRHFFSELLQPLVGRADIVVLPEMFSTGFSMQAAQLAEPMTGPTVQWMQEQAQYLGAVVAGSIIILDNGRFYNRLLWVSPDGSVQHYDKRHLFALAGEHDVFTAGTERTIVQWNDWRVALCVCYDLRFPNWARQHRHAEPYDLLIYVANWPVTRSHHWRALLQARAIENQCFTAGVNIVGTDGNQLEYIGDTQLVDYNGQVIGHLAQQPAVLLLTLDRAAMLTYRERLPFLKDGE